MLGYTEEELGQLSFLEITHEDDRAATRWLIAGIARRSRQQFQIEKRYRRKDGQLIWVSNNVRLYQARRAIHNHDGYSRGTSRAKRLQGHLELERTGSTSARLTKNVPRTWICCGFAARWLSASDGLCTAICRPRLARFRDMTATAYAFDSLEGRTIFPEGMTWSIMGTPAGLAFRLVSPSV